MPKIVQLTNVWISLSENSNVYYGIYHSQLLQSTKEFKIRIRLIDEIPKRSIICGIQAFSETGELITELTGLSYSESLNTRFSYVDYDNQHEYGNMGTISSEIYIKSVRMTFYPWGKESSTIPSNIIDFVGVEHVLRVSTWSPDSSAVGTFLSVSREVE